MASGITTSWTGVGVSMSSRTSAASTLRGRPIDSKAGRKEWGAAEDTVRLSLDRGLCPIVVRAHERERPMPGQHVREADSTKGGLERPQVYRCRRGAPDQNGHEAGHYADQP